MAIAVEAAELMELFQWKNLREAEGMRKKFKELERIREVSIGFHPRSEMHLLVFGDIHCDWEALKKIVAQKADLYICLGDLSDVGKGLEKAGEILAPLGERLWLIPGNNETHRQIQTLCKKYGFVDFHQKVKKIGDFVLAGLGYSVPTPFSTPGEVSEEEMHSALEKFRGDKNLFLFCHNPPKDTEFDVIPDGAHVGSQSIKKFIEKNQPIYFFCGHIHENEGKVQRIAQTTCFGVGKRGLLLFPF